MQRKAKAMNKIFGYRNETHNGAARVVGTREQAEAKIVELSATYAGTTFALVTFKIVECTESSWQTGRGLAGNDYRMARNVTRYVEIR